ncbi:MAG: glycosyltransferase family 39 protein, partial [Rickettsiales bacterium]|nr:glycosyltransferase family 39 protein [Rickettsiales bacterium]
LHRRLARLPLPAPIFVAGCALALLGITIGLSAYCFGLLPASVDSNAQYVQGKIFAQGKFYLPELPHRWSFPIWMMVTKEKIFAQYQPLHSLLLAGGHLLGAPWLVNPLCAAITLAGVYFLALRIFGVRTARLSALLFLTSPFVLFMSAEYMNHASAMLCATFFMLCYVHAMDAARENNPPRARLLALAAGAFLGGLFLVRPFTAIGMGWPFVAYALSRAWRDPRRFIAPLLAAGATLSVCLGINAWVNYTLSGDPFMFASAHYHTKSLASAIGYGRDTTFGYTLAKTQYEWWQMNFYLYEWPVPCLLTLVLCLLRPLRSPYAKLLLAAILTHTLMNMLNQFVNNTFGPRYLYELAVPLILLGAAGVMRLPLVFHRHGR